jgi:putative Mg2+ transporter-C (MgtC) family protein
MELILATDHVNLYNSLFRLFLGLIAGGIIGINREKINRAAGFRTHILICMGSCLLMLISIYMTIYKGGDAGRIAAQVVTGIGFLGAGAIIKLGDHIKGLTTAASIWISAAIGLAIGAGMLWIAMAATLLVLFTLVIMEKIERVLFKKRYFKSVSMQLKQPGMDLSPVESILKEFKIKFDMVEYSQNTYMGLLHIELVIAVPERFPMRDFLEKLSDIPNLQEISVKNKN